MDAMSILEVVSVTFDRILIIFYVDSSADFADLEVSPVVLLSFGWVFFDLLPGLSCL